MRPDFTQSRNEWEQAVIANAVTYTVFVPKVGAWRCDTLAEAEEIASEHERGTCVWRHRLGAFDAD